MTGTAKRFGTGPTCPARGYRLGPGLLFAAALAPLAAALAAASPAGALVVQGDPDAAARPPEGVAGFAHVGRVLGTTGVYLGDGWVVTAGHVGAGDLELRDGTHPAVPGSWVALGAPSGAQPPDLGLFRVDPPPPLPSLAIARRPPRPGEALLLVGCGLGRGKPFVWEGRAGWTWAAPGMCRWGRNRIAAVGLDTTGASRATRTFATLFSEGEPEEAQAAQGDSGGAGFALRRGGWTLVGIMIAVKISPGQPPKASMIGDTTYLADLHHYRADVLAIIGRDPAAELR